MKRPVAIVGIVAFSMLIAACGSPAKKLQGHWVYANSAAANMPGGMPTLEITDSQITLKEMGTTILKYKVTKVEGQDVTLDVDEGFGPHTSFVATVNGDSLIFDRAKNHNPMLGGTEWKRQ